MRLSWNILQLTLIVITVYSTTTVDYLRQNQHVTINRDGTDVDVKFGDIIKVNGRQMTYIGNKQWIGVDSSGNWDYANPQEMPASYFLTVHQFEETGNKLSSADIQQLKEKNKSFGDAFNGESEEEQSTVYNHGMQTIYQIGKGIQIFLMLYFGIIVAIISFLSATYIGYKAWDYNLKRLAQVLQEKAIYTKDIQNPEEISFAKHEAVSVNVCNFVCYPCTFYNS